MVTLESIIGAIHDLSDEDKAKLRLLLQEESNSVPPSNGSDKKSAKRIIGLFADEPELIDRVLESVRERRSRAMRIED